MCKKHFILFWLAHILLPSPPLSMLSNCSLVSFLLRFLLRSFSIVFFSFFICFHLCRLASSSCIVGGWLLDVRASVYISAATVCAVCCVCAIIDINAKHQNVFQQLCVSFDAWLALAVAARPHLTCCCVVKLWRRQQCLNILRYHGAMKRNCVRMRLPLAPCVSCV